MRYAPTRKPAIVERVYHGSWTAGPQIHGPAEARLRVGVAARIREVAAEVDEAVGVGGAVDRRQPAPRSPLLAPFCPALAANAPDDRAPAAARFRRRYRHATGG